MKTIKPQRLGVLTRTFEASGRVQLCVTGLVAMPFDAPRALMHEASLWKMLAAELGRDTPPDLGMPKPRGELLVTGSAYARGGAPQPAVSVRVALGQIDKTLWVVGDRHWNGSVASDPIPFTDHPVTWAGAFGGAGHAVNPAGKGLAPLATDAGPQHPLPNVEDPKHLVRSPKDRPAPVGFAPYGLDSPLRQARSGTYDDAWLEQQFPGLPLDFDFEYYSVAPLDQRLDGYFRGDEAFRVEHMHPDKPLLEGRLPGIVARVFVRTKGEDALREVPMRLETVQLLPRAERALILFRGVTEVVEDDASDVVQLVAGCEAIGAPRSVAHYRAVLEERLDKKRGALASLRDSDLMPEGEAGKTSIAELVDEDLGTPFEDLKRQNMRRKAEAELDATRARIRAAGLDPDEHLPAELPPDPSYAVASLDDLEDTVLRAHEQIEAAKVTGEAKRKEAEAGARKQMADAGLDFDAAVEAQKKKGGGPPKLTAAGELSRLRDLATLSENGGVPLPTVTAALADPRLPGKLQAAEDATRDAYRRNAHRMNAADASDRPTTERARVELPAGAAGGVSFARRDLTGVDLSGLDLRGIDLRDAFLEAASLAGANLAGADLGNAVLARADLSGADLTGARLAGANLGKATLRGAKLGGGADLTGAILGGADLTEASFAGARLVRTDVSEAVFRDTDFTGVIGENLTFMASDLRGLKLAGASLRKCNFIDVDLGGVDLEGADLEGAAFVGVRADRAIFRRAKLAKLRVVKDSTLEGADFTGAHLEQANLRGTKLAGADFSGAELGGADLSECDLRGARFYRATGREVRMTKADLSQASLVGANLMFALLDRAKLHGTSFLGANLFRADLAKVDVDGATVTTEANLKQIRFVKARRASAKG